MKINEILNESKSFLKWKKIEKKKAESTDSDGNKPEKDPGTRHSIREGRERLITRISNVLEERGESVNRATLKNYIVYLYRKWHTENPEVQWILDLEKKAKAMGFDPREYKDQKEGDSAGANTIKGEYAGRAFFFSAFVDEVVNHFEEEGEEKAAKVARWRERKRKENVERLGEGPGNLKTQFQVEKKKKKKAKEKANKQKKEFQDDLNYYINKHKGTASRVKEGHLNNKSFQKNPGYLEDYKDNYKTKGKAWFDLHGGK